jgi:small subunit ribosomal protein S17
MEMKDGNLPAGSQEKKIITRKKGVVVSNKMEKTAVVAVVSFKTHPKYKKKYKVTKRYKAHDEENKCQIGDVVEIAPCRPISKDKSYRIVT